jgi:hypothetical protein
MTTKNQTNKPENNTTNKPARCIVCGGLTPHRECKDKELFPCHHHCLDKLYQRGSQELTATAEVVVGVV